MMPRAMFSEVVVKSKFIYFSKSLELNRLADETRSSKGGSLNVFFTTKTQKLEIPFQTVSEGGHGNEFLLKISCKLNPEDSFRINNSCEVAEFIKCTRKVDRAFFVDIDPFYSKQALSFHGSLR